VRPYYLLCGRRSAGSAKEDICGDLALRLDRYRCVLLKNGLHVEGDGHEAAQDEASAIRTATHLSKTTASAPSSSETAAEGSRMIPPLAIGTRIPKILLGWIERDTAQAAGLVAEYLWSLFPIREILEEHGTYDQDDAPLDREAQLGSFVSSAIDYLEDAYELLNGRRPVPISVHLAEAAIE
jgi:hypothetical protein